MRSLGYYPKESWDVPKEERQTARQIRDARHDNRFTTAQLTELDELQRTSVQPLDRARSTEFLEKAQEPRNPMEGFANEAKNRLDQCLLLLSSGHRTRDLQQELKQYCVEQTYLLQSFLLRSLLHGCLRRFG